MDRLSAMELFVVAMAEGSLSRGARRLGRPAAAATRAVTMLEREVGETLLIRSTRRIGLTAAGEHWLRVWREVLGQLAAGRDGPGFGGTIVITAPEQFGRGWVQPLLEEFLWETKALKVEARLLLLTRTVDLLPEGVDLAIRVGELPENGVVATRLGQVRRLLCAAPAYLERRGEPTEPADLREHDCIGLIDTGDVWPFRDPQLRRAQAVAVSPRLKVNVADAVTEAILRGRGIGHVMSCHALSYIKAGQMVPILRDREPGSIPVHLVFRGRPPQSGPVRDFIDRAVPTLRQKLAEIEAAVELIIADRDRPASKGAGAA